MPLNLYPHRVGVTLCVYCDVFGERSCRLLRLLVVYISRASNANVFSYAFLFSALELVDRAAVVVVNCFAILRMKGRERRIVITSRLVVAHPSL